jgi:hypothetical protein
MSQNGSIVNQQKQRLYGRDFKIIRRGSDDVWHRWRIILEYVDRTIDSLNSQENRGGQEQPMCAIESAIFACVLLLLIIACDWGYIIVNLPYLERVSLSWYFKLFHLIFDLWKRFFDFLHNFHIFDISLYSRSVCRLNCFYLPLIAK